MSAIIRPVLTRRALVFAFLSSLTLSLALACASVSTPVESTPPVPTATPVADGIVQVTGEAATPRPPRTSAATPQTTEEVQSTANTASDSKDNSESVLQSGGTGGDAQSGLLPKGEGTGEDSQAPSIPEKGELRYPNLGSHLDELVASVESGETTAEEAASSAAMHTGASIGVTIHLSDNVDHVVAFLQENGGDPRNVSEDYVEAYVPVTQLGPVSEQPGVLRVREIVPPEPGRAG